MIIVTWLTDSTGQSRRKHIPLRSLLPRRDRRGEHNQGFRQLHQRVLCNRWCQWRRRDRRRRHVDTEERASDGGGQGVQSQFSELHEGPSFPPINHNSTGPAPEVATLLDTPNGTLTTGPFSTGLPRSVECTDDPFPCAHTHIELPRPYFRARE